MAKIYDFNEYRDRKLRPQKGVNKPKTVVVVNTPGDLNPLLKALDLGERLLGLSLNEKLKEKLDIQRRIIEIQTYLNSLRGPASSSETIRIRKEVVYPETTDHLVHVVMFSTELDWTNHRAYYQAVIDELGNRNFDFLNR